VWTQPTKTRLLLYRPGITEGYSWEKMDTSIGHLKMHHILYYTFLTTKT